MKTTFVVVAGLASIAYAQVTALITPTSSAPEGCATSYSGAFQISTVNVSSVAKRQQKRADCSSSLAVTLNDGILKDQQDRTGYIASNTQFQFDGPPQTGAIYTGGWSVCSNGSLTLGGSAVFYQCLSGTFNNLYTESQGEQCSQILIQTTACSSAAGSGAVGQSTDGQAIATAIASVSSAAVSQISDGQPQGATSAAPISQISDGQIQAPTSAGGAPITQISDGQVQGATSVAIPSAEISQIPDGQIQGATSTVAIPSAEISQIPDGQIQGATSTVAIPSAQISQIPDGQIQGATSAAAVPSAVVSQIPDGQIQAPTGVATLETSTSLAGPVISQISDGQIQAPTATATNVTYSSTTSAPAVFTGAANTYQISGSLAAAAIGLFAALL
ncbi:uncharacterized protein EAF01_005140 [Botrytis porri]|uniref:uncharacterized protein n=1 Tax=Botrytis porri TaxID=87229 RepID=UPI0018FF9B3F|nr:uncharacterized protein EAF01_005140 [Botrytis porri]KAF7907554.1 hypothetical protein EAF01_005140 [Botrytis porri]